MKVVVLGGGYAGILCALRLARGGAEVTLVNRTDRFVERIRLHEAAVGRGPRVRSIARFVEGTGVELVIGHAFAVDTAARNVALDDGRALAYDELVLALGSRPEAPPRADMLALDSAGAAALAARLPTARRVLVLGAGLTGIETAAEIAEAYPECRVTLATRSAVAGGFTAAAQAHVTRWCEAHDIEIALNTDYAAAPLPACDVTVWAGGFRAAELPRGLRVKTNGRGQVLVEASLRAVGVDAVWVCGDLAAQAHPPAIPIPMGCKTAGPSAAQVADNILARRSGRALAPFDFVAIGYCVSLGRRDGFVELASGRVVTGRIAAWIKELICTLTVWSFALERRGWVDHSRFRGGNVAAQPAAVSSEAGAGA